MQKPMFTNVLHSFHYCLPTLCECVCVGIDVCFQERKNPDNIFHASYQGHFLQRVLVPKFCLNLKVEIMFNILK